MDWSSVGNALVFVAVVAAGCGVGELVFRQTFKRWGIVGAALGTLALLAALLIWAGLSTDAVPQILF